MEAFSSAVRGMAPAARALVVGRAAPPAVRKPERGIDGAIGLAPSAGGSPPWLAIGFVLLVALPTFATLAYFLLLAAPQYVSETRFVVRGAVERLTLEGGIGQSASLSALNNSQEAHIVAGFVRSRAMVEVLLEEHDLGAMYARPRLDVLARLGSEASLDEISRYWRRMVEATVDSTSGVVVVRIAAFRPEDAQALAQSVLAASERLVNAFSARLRRDKVAQAEREVAAARAEMADLLSEYEAARGDRGAIDALDAATSVQELAAMLRAERASREAALVASAARLQPGAPSVVMLEGQMRALDERIAALDAALSADEPVGAISRFSAIEARRELVRQRLSRAETMATRARIEAVRQQVYLDVFMPPTLAQAPFRPNALPIALATFAVLLATWGLGTLYVAGVVDRAR